MTQLHFLFGVAPRSGTTYLGDLLALHPACSSPSELPEDGLLLPIDHLDAYVKALEIFWRSWPQLATPNATETLGAIGSGVSKLVADRSSSDVVITKTPFPTNLNRLGELFPTSKGVVIVRDGRAVVESTIRSWGSPFDVCAARFRDGARSIVEALDGPGSENLIVTTYEKLFTEPEVVVGEVLAFLDLDPALFPTSEIEHLPVRGSSTLTGAETSSVHWEGVERPEDFDPTARWSAWTEREHRLFAAIAGPENEALGYGQAEPHLADEGMAILLAGRRALARRLPPALYERLRSGRAT